MKPLMTFYQIEWRGVITRDVGRDVEQAESKEQARTQFEARYPMRKIVSITELEP